jgi:hypothetical protein
MNTYEGQCHCGAVRFRLRSEPITTGMRCNCSYCKRRNAVMSSQYYDPDHFEILSGEDDLTFYHWGDVMVNHYFCRHCGIYTFHDAIENPGTGRVNLGCFDIDLDSLQIRRFDGADTWQYLD